LKLLVRWLLETSIVATYLCDYVYIIFSEQRKQLRYKTKEDIKQEEEDLIRKIIMEKMDIRGGYQKPEYTDVLWMQIILLPYYLFRYVLKNVFVELNLIHPNAVGLCYM